MIQQSHSWACLEKTTIQKEGATPVSTASLFTIVKHENNQNAHQKRRHKEDMVHKHNGILLSQKKGRNAICSNTDDPRDCHTE